VRARSSRRALVAPQDVDERAKSTRRDSTGVESTRVELTSAEQSSVDSARVDSNERSLPSSTKKPTDDAAPPVGEFAARRS